MRPLRRTTGFLLATLLLIPSSAFATSGAHEGGAESGIHTLQQVNPAVGSIARHLAAGSDRTGEMLRAIGYTPSIPAQSWDALPAIHKLEQAYVQAEAARAGGGDQLLARLSRDLALRYESVGYEPALAHLNSTSPPERIRFAPPAAGPRPRLPSRVEAAITSIAKYSDGGALGGTSGVLQHHFGLPPNRAYEILRTSASSEEALLRGYSEIPPSARQARLARTASAVQSVYESARMDPALNGAASAGRSRSPISASNRGVDPPFSAPSASGGGGGPPPSVGPSGTRPGVRSSSRSSFGTRYRTYRTASYPTVGTRGFRTMVGRARGFGGVVFGNEVADDPDLPDVRAVSWIPDDAGGAWGRLVFRFADDSERVVGPVLHEDVYAAHATTFAGAGGVEAAEDGEGIGLVGIHDPSPHYTIEDGALRNRGRRWQVVMHPAIAHLDLGWATLYVDVLPIASTELRELIARNGTSAELDQVDALLADLPATWKVIDVPARILEDHGQLGVERQADADRSYSVDLRRQALIGIQGFEFGPDDGETLDSEFSHAFYQLVPALVHASRDYHRLNGFARVFALLQWSRGEGAEFRGAPAEPPAIPTPETIIVDVDAVVPAEAAPPSATGEILTELLPTQGRLELGRPVSGTLGASDLAWTDGAPSETWEVQLQEGAVMTVELRSPEFDAYLYVFGPGLDCILENDDGGGGFNSRLVFRAPSTGSYRVVATSLGGGGAFTLSATGGGDSPDECGDLEDLPDLADILSPVSVGETVTGELTPADVPLDDGTYADLWELTGEAGQTVWIDLVSRDFDAYLVVEGPGLAEGLFDDDGGGACNARVQLTFPESGSFLLLANSVSPEATGRYSLSVLTAPGPITPGTC